MTDEITSRMAAAASHGGSVTMTEDVRINKWLEVTRWERRAGTGWWLPALFLLAPALISLLALWQRHDHIETKLENRIGAQLATKYPGVKVKFEGRDATLSGTLPAGVQVGEIHAFVRGSKEVRHVDEEFGAAAAPAQVTVPATSAVTEPATSAVVVTAATNPPPVETTVVTAAPTTTPPPPPPSQDFKVFFDTSKTNVRPDQQGTIDQAVAAIKALPAGSTVKIVGVADQRGSTGLNARLSSGRAEQVKAALIAAGANANYEITAKGAEPSDDLQAARRVEIDLP